MDHAHSPLEILMTVMRDRFDNQDFDGAVAIAKAVAPFVHAKPNARTAPVSLAMLKDEQLVELCPHRVARAGDAAGDTK